jgi:LPXTG-motif cell wall-anchored protein
MRSFLYSAAMFGFVFSSGFAIANPPSTAPITCAACGKKAPAPEMGASLVGLGMAGALAFYLVRRRRDARA